MNDISAIIVVKDNPPHLFETISSVQDFVKEIIVADIGVDSSLLSKLAKNKKVKIVEIKKKVTYVELIREELKQYASEKCLLYLDPDEIFPEKAKEIIKKEIKNYDCFSFPRKNIIFNKWINHSRWWPDYQIRLFKKDCVFWTTNIHSQPKVQGKLFTLPANERYAFTHFNYKNLDEFLSKFFRYAKAEAQNIIESNKNFTFEEAVSKAVSEFIGRFFSHEGYKDGMHGFVLAVMQMFYYFLVYFYIWEKRNYFENEEKTISTWPHRFFSQIFVETGYWLNKKKLISGLNKVKTKFANFIAKSIYEK